MKRRDLKVGGHEVLLVVVSLTFQKEPTFQ